MRKIKLVNDYKTMFLALGIKKNIIPLELYTAKFPQELYKRIMELKEGEDKDKNLFLNNYITTLKLVFTDLLFARQINEKNLEMDWLYSVSEINMDYIRGCLKEWLRLQFNNEYIDDSLFEKITWNKKIVNIDFSKLNSFGTVVPNQEAFNILPNYIAFKIKDIPMYYNDYHFEFKVVNSTRGAELVSYPPREITYHDEETKEEKKVYYSYKIELSIQTIPSQNNAYLYVQPRVIRWMNRPFNLYKYNDGKFNPYILIDDNLKVGNNSSNFINAPIKAKENQDKTISYNWDYFFKKMLGMLGISDRLPNANKIVTNSDQYVSSRNKEYFFVGVPYGTHIKGAHPIKPGLGGDERLQLASMVKNEVQRVLKDIFFEEFMILDKLSTNSFRYVNFEFISKLRDNLTIEIYYKDKNIVGLILDELADELSLEKVGDNTFRNIKYKKDIYIKEIDMSEWGEDFFIVEYDKSIDEKQAKDKYKKDIYNFKIRLSDKVKNSDANVVASIFELEGAQFFDKRYDPKSDIRTIFLEKNKLCQFITPLNDTELIEKINEGKLKKKLEDKRHKSRFSMASADLLRQLGCIRKDINYVFHKVPNALDIAHIGIWIHKEIINKKTVNIPFLSCIFDNEVYIHFPGIGDWMRYDEVPFEIIRRKRELFNTKINDNYIIDAVKQFETDYETNHIIIYTLAQNSRTMIKYLQNPNINDESVDLTFGWGQGRNNSSKYSIVRLRDKSTGEVPEWITYKNGINYSLHPASLCKMNDNIGFSIGDWRSTFKLQTKYCSKHEVPNIQISRNSAVEVTLINNSNIFSNDELLLAVHKMRFGFQMSSINEKSSKDYNILPIPLHLIKILLNDIL